MIYRLQLLYSVLNHVCELLSLAGWPAYDLWCCFNESGMNPEDRTANDCWASYLSSSLDSQRDRTREQFDGG